MTQDRIDFHDGLQSSGHEACRNVFRLLPQTLISVFRFSSASVIEFDIHEE
jgi:hypothetical protein